MRKAMKRRAMEAVGLFLLGAAIGLFLWPGCGTNPPTPNPGPAPVVQLTVDCGVPSTRAQMAEVTPPLSRCVQASTPVDSCVASLQKKDGFPTGWPLDAIMCAGRARGMLAWRANAEGAGTPGDAIEATAWRDFFKAQNVRFKY